VDRDLLSTKIELQQSKMLPAVVALGRDWHLTAIAAAAAESRTLLELSGHSSQR
jgi:hypothetical protein